MLCGALLACAASVLAPGDFTTRLDNPYLPMRPGSRWVYRETEAGRGGTRVDRAVSGGSGREELVRYEPGGRPRRASSSSKRASGSSSSSPISSRSRASR
jgi:hypothetical protein